MRTVLTLPFPPSVNSLYINGRHRRAISKRYEDWQIKAWAALVQQPDRFHRHVAPVHVIYTFGRPDNRRRDVFNLEKAVSDLLVKHGVLADDTLIERGTVQWGSEPGVVILIEPL